MSAGDPFMAFVAFQREVLSFQQRNLDLTARALKMGQDVLTLQAEAHKAGMAGVGAWLAWVGPQDRRR